MRIRSLVCCLSVILLGCVGQKDSGYTKLVETRDRDGKNLYLRQYFSYGKPVIPSATRLDSIVVNGENAGVYFSLSTAGPVDIQAIYISMSRSDTFDLEGKVSQINIQQDERQILDEEIYKYGGNVRIIVGTEFEPEFNTIMLLDDSLAPGIYRFEPAFFPKRAGLQSVSFRSGEIWDFLPRKKW